MRILVTGASGFIGRHLVPRLRADGHDVLILRRGEGSAPADLATIGRWQGWPPGVEAVVHLAALNPSRHDGASRDPAWLTRVNVDGTRALAERAAAEGVQRFVFASTALVQRPVAGRAITESTLPSPQNPYAESKLAAETAVWEVAARTGLEVCVLRPPSVYGKGGRGSVAALIQLARTRLPFPLGDPARRGILSVGNAADALAVCLTHPAAAGETFLVADAEPMSLGEMIAALRRGLGREPRVLPFPRKILATLAARLSRQEAFERLFGSFVLDTGKIERQLDWRPPETSEDALGRAIRGDDEAGTP